MSNNHIITRNIGNLRGFSTASSFIRPSNVAETAINLQRSPAGTLQIRRGYQCQIADIGGMGLGTFNDPFSDTAQTVCIGLDGFLYQKQEKQIYFYYDGQVTGAITGVTQANPAVVDSPGHGLMTGAVIIIRGVNGMTNLNNNTYTITVIDINHFSLNGVDSTGFPAYIDGGTWSIAFADMRYLTFTIFTDPRFLTSNPGWSVAPWSVAPWGAPSGESITCNITVNRAAQVSLNAMNTNTATVFFGQELAVGDVIQFYDINGIFNQRNVTNVTPTTVTFDGYPVTIQAGMYINQFFDILFRKGFDVTDPYLISTFIATITDPVNGVFGLQVAINGEDDHPAAFIQIIEPVIIDSNNTFIQNYWYWTQCNSTINPPLPGSANIRYQNSPEMEIASIIAYDDVCYIANGWDYPQKFDGQTIYRTGMPEGQRPTAVDNTIATIQPFTIGNVYQYAITYEQIDNRGRLVEGVLSEIESHTVTNATAAIDVTVNNLQSTIANNWNTNCAIATGGSATVYGPDANGFYYDYVSVNSGYTLKIGDSAYYLDLKCATISATVTNVFVLPVNAGHNVAVGDTIYFPDTSPNILHQRIVTETTATTITIQGAPVDVTSGTFIQDYKVSPVYGDIAIVNGAQTNVSVINVHSGHSIQINDVVNFIDASNLLQRRNVTNTSGTTITVDSVPVSVTDGLLIVAMNMSATSITLQRTNSGAADLGASAPISNNLRINIYRTMQGQTFGVNGNIYLVASIPNNSIAGATQVYTDEIPDDELGPNFINLVQQSNPPPISKYLVAYGNQVFYAGGERGNPENANRVFFSEGNEPESVDLATNFFNVPNIDDDVTGIGVSGTTLIVTKNKSLWAATGNFLSSQIDVIQISPGKNIGCVAHATIHAVGGLMYFLHSNGLYSIAETQLFPTDAFGNPIPLSFAIDVLFRTTPFIPSMRYRFKRAVGFNYTKDNQYWLFLPCEDVQSSIRTANSFSQVLMYDYEEKNWFQWYNVNAAGGMVMVGDDIFFQERRFSAVDGNVANLYKQHRFYRLVDHADHAGPQVIEWKSSWEDLGQPEVRKKFCRAVLLMDRLSDLYQYNNPQMTFSTYLNRLANLQSTIANINQTDNIRNATWSFSPWGWGFWSGYQDTFVTVNLKQGTVAKSMQIGLQIKGINMDISLAGFQLEAIPENRKTVVR